mgnify:CR=1 FL=1
MATAAASFAAALLWLWLGDPLSGLLWLAASALLTLILTLANWNDFSTAALIAALLFPYLVFPWFLVVLVLGVGPVSTTRTESLADGPRLKGDVILQAVADEEYQSAGTRALIGEGVKADAALRQAITPRIPSGG